MSGFAVAIVLSAAACHAGWNILAHGVSRLGVPFLWWGAVGSTVLWALAIPFTGGLGTGSLGAFLLGVSVSGVLHVLYMFVLQRGYAAGGLSTVYATARGTGPTISVLVAVLVLGERPAPIALAGVVAIVVGVVAIGLVDRSTVERAASSRRFDRGLLYGLLTGAAIAAYTIWDAHAVRSGAAPVAYMVGCTLAEIPLYTAVLLRRGAEVREVGRRHWPRILAFAVLSPASYILVLWAVTLAPLSLVAPMREVSVILVSLFGAFVLREGRAGWRVAAALTVVAGVALLAG